RVQVARGGRDARRSHRGDLFRVPVLDHAESAELPLDAVEIPVVVSEAGDEPVAADVIVGGDALDDVNWKGNACDPRPAGELVGGIEIGRGGVFDVSLRPEVVDHVDQQMRLATGHQVHVPQRRLLYDWKRR